MRSRPWNSAVRSPAEPEISVGSTVSSSAGASIAVTRIRPPTPARPGAARPPIGCAAPADGAGRPEPPAPGRSSYAASTFGGRQTWVQSGGWPLAQCWKLNLYEGYKFVFMVNSSTVNSYTFDMYPPGTTDANFRNTKAVSYGFTNYQAESTISLQAPYNGTFVLAVCENVNTCSLASKVMNPYTFRTGLIVP